MKNIPLYNSLIIKTYIEYLREYYPDVDIKHLLDCSEIAVHELEDRGHWLTQEQVNRFYDNILAASSNAPTAREAGRYVLSAKSSSLLRQLVAAFMSPGMAYWALEKVGATLTRHQTMKINRLTNNKIEIVTTPHSYVQEQPFQCENRIGMFEAVAKLFTHKYAEIEHPECTHSGGNCCRYIVSWEMESSRKWKRTGNFLLAFSATISLLFYFMLSFNHWLIFSLSSLLISAIILLLGSIFQTKEMAAYLRGQGLAADKLVEETNIHYNEALLIKEIGEASSSILDSKKMLNYIATALQERLLFKRGMIMLANPEKTKLMYAAGYGFTPQEEELLKATEFNLSNPQYKEVFYLAYHNQKHFLIHNINNVQNSISDQSSKLIKELGVSSFICVPIIYEGKSEGLLIVDSTKAENPPTQSDVSLMLGIASQIAVSFNKQRLYEEINKLNQNLEQKLVEHKASNESLATINAISDAVYHSLDLDTVVKQAAKAMDDFFHTPSVSVFMIDEEKSCLEQVFASDPGWEAARLIPTLSLSGGSLTALTVARQDIVICEDVAKDEYMRPDVREAIMKRGRQSILSLPLLFRDQVLGAMNLFFKEKRTFTLSERETFLSIGKTIGLAMANARHVSRIEAEIKERKKAEEALLESEAKYRGIFDNSTEGIFQSTIEGRFMTANPFLARMLGYDSPEDLLEKVISFKDQLYVDSSRMQELLKQMDMNGGLVKGFEFKAYRKDKNIIDVGVNSHIVPDENGKALYFEGIMTDITEKKRIRELTMAKEVAEAANKTKSEFLANMSHEIRTPMNAIIGFSALALKTELSVKQRNYIKKVETSAKSLLGVINDILDFSKIEAGRLEFESVKFQLNDSLTKIGDMFSFKAAEKGIELIISIADDVPRTLVGDPLRLEQVLINLISNAVKFTQTGHIIVQVDQVEKNDKSCKLQFSCSDTGIGITKEQLVKLFKAFSQADTSMSRKFGGTGLGLIISKRLVKMMDGKITVDSEPGKGSTFIFTAEFKLQPEDKEQQIVVPLDLRNLKVLVVDDNKIVQKLFVQQLESLKFQVAAIDSGEAAIQELERVMVAGEKPYDLILMDWNMRGMDGIEAARKMKNRFPLKSVPKIILVTAFGREEIMEQAETEGIINAFIMKPTNPSVLFDIIMEVFGKQVPKTIKMNIASNEQLVEEKIRGASILLVEDNVINQQVAAEILESIGLRVEIAQNGREAIEAIAKSTYDLVFMDVQMPVMDGYEATALIRKDERFRELPIVAMTAHAVSGAKEECLAAGMNDYVSKPIDPALLFSVLNKWIKPGLRKAKAISKKSDNDIAFPEGLEGIDLEAGLKRVNGNRKLYSQLLLAFAKDYAAVTQDIEDMIKQGDIKKAERLAHTIKGIAGNISADGIQAAAGDLEVALADKNEEVYEKLLTGLDRVLLPVLESINRFIPAETFEPLPENVPVDTETAGQILREMGRLLRDFNPDAEKYLETVKENIGDSRFHDEIKQLEECVVRFDFKLALNPLQKIADALNNSERK
jgi:PAS domain S-box-containing protein